MSAVTSGTAGLRYVVRIGVNRCAVYFNKRVSAGEVYSALVVNIGNLNYYLVAYGYNILNLFNTLGIKL